jgi:hypothetical protein
MNRRFGGTYRLHLQDTKIRERGTQDLHGATIQKKAFFTNFIVSRHSETNDGLPSSILSRFPGNTFKVNRIWQVLKICALLLPQNIS